jgi:hypothetical protein
MIALAPLPRAQPLTPCAGLGLGPTARTLAERLLRLPDERLLRLRGVSGSDLILVCGDEAALPWCEGIGYLGRDADAPGLLLPTREAVNAPSALLERALAGRATPPLAVWFSPWLIVPVSGARTLERSALQRWLSA